MRGKVVFRALSYLKIYFQTSSLNPSSIFERRQRKILAKRTEKFDTGRFSSVFYAVQETNFPDFFGGVNLPENQYFLNSIFLLYLKGKMRTLENVLS